MYNNYFGFPESPFNVTPDPRFFYTNPVYKEAFAALSYGIEAKKGFIVITGEVGTGKTTLLRKLMRNLGDTIHSVFIFNTLLNFPELLELILHDLGLTPGQPSKVTMIQELNAYLLKQLKDGHVVCVLIDEAQNLSDEALEGLRLLSNLETDQEKLLQIVLMGQPELKTKLDQPGLRQLKQRVAFQGQLAPLKEEETGPYIEFRLRTAGYAGKELFQPDAIQQIAFYSQGIPRLINIICDHALLNAYAESKKLVSAQMIQEVGRDLRLGPEVPVARADTTPVVTVSKDEQEVPFGEGSIPVRLLQTRPLVRAGVWAAVASLAFIVLASAIDPQTFLRVSVKALEISRHNLGQWAAFASYPHTVSEPIAAGKTVAAKMEAPVVEPTWKQQRILIPPGATISEIASNAYGANSFLALDIIKEFNPQIQNLNRIFPGQDLLIPPLSRETMLRKHADGSYRLILASLSSQSEAERYAHLLNDVGYQVVITPRPVSDNLLLHRVEIDGFKSLAEADHVWRTELTN
jgi:type II secretory pathway predicted ATPase ExeA